MRAVEQDPETRVRTSHLDLANNPTVRNIVSAAEAEDDPTSITPTSKVSSVASAPVAAFGEESTEDHMFNDKAKKVLEAALKQPLEDLADENDDPLGIRGKMLEAAEEHRRNQKEQACPIC